MLCPKCRVLFIDGKCKKCGLIHRLKRFDTRRLHKRKISDNK